jgi:hypothetical protein
MDEMSFAEEVVPFGRSGTTEKGGGVWQLLIREFIDSGMSSAKVNFGGRDFKQAYASLAHAIKAMGVRNTVRAVRRTATNSVYLERLDAEPSDVPFITRFP